MNCKVSKVLFICFVLFVALLSVGCGSGGGGSSSVIPTAPGVPGSNEGATTGNKVVEGYVSKSSISAGIRANILANNISNPAINVEVEAGDYDEGGEFVSFNIKTKTDNFGKYTLTGLPANRKNIIIRAKISDDQIFENVIPYIPENKDKIIAPIIDPDTIYIAKLVKYAEQYNKAYEINVYEVLSKIPLSDLKQLQENEIKELSHKFVEKEQAQLQLFRKLGIQDEKFVKFRDFAFEIQLEIMEQVNNGNLSAEEGWNSFNQMLQLRIKTLGLPQDVIKLSKDIEAQTVKKALDAFISATTKAKFRASFYREEILAKLDNLLWALNIFDVNTTELDNRLNELKAILQNYTTEEDIQKYLDIAPIKVFVKEAIWKVIEKLHLLDGNPPLITKLYLTPDEVHILNQSSGFVPEHIEKFVTSSNFEKPSIGGIISSDKIAGFYSSFYDLIMKKIETYLPQLKAEESKALYIILFETQELGLFVPPSFIQEHKSIPEQYTQVKIYGIIISKDGKFYIALPEDAIGNSKIIAEIDETSNKYHHPDSTPRIYIGKFNSSGKFIIFAVETPQTSILPTPQPKEIELSGIIVKVQQSSIFAIKRNENLVYLEIPPTMQDYINLLVQSQEYVKVKCYILELDPQSGQVKKVKAINIIPSSQSYPPSSDIVTIKAFATPYGNGGLGKKTNQSNKYIIIQPQKLDSHGNLIPLKQNGYCDYIELVNIDSSILSDIEEILKNSIFYYNNQQSNLAPVEVIGKFIGEGIGEENLKVMQFKPFKVMLLAN